MKFASKRKFFIVFLTAMSTGLTWGIIYLVLSDLHDMTKMFNDEFIFAVASIFRIDVTGKFQGFLLSGLDGFLLGILIGFILINFTVDDS